MHIRQKDEFLTGVLIQQVIHIMRIIPNQTFFSCLPDAIETESVAGALVKRGVSTPPTVVRVSARGILGTSQRA